MSVELLSEHHSEILSLKAGCTGSSESTLVKMTHCWKSHVVAQLIYARSGRNTLKEINKSPTKIETRQICLQYFDQEILKSTSTATETKLNY